MMYDVMTPFLYFYQKITVLMLFIRPALYPHKGALILTALSLYDVMSPFLSYKKITILIICDK
jgi:hypothetical protein